LWKIQGMQVVFILKLFHFYFLLFSGTLHGMYSMVNWGRKSLRSQPKLVLNNISLYTTVNTSQFSLCSFIYPYDSNHKHLKSHHNDNREAELLLSDRTHLRHLSTFFRWLCIEFLKSVHFPRVMFWKIVVLVFFFAPKRCIFAFIAALSYIRRLVTLYPTFSIRRTHRAISNSLKEFAGGMVTTSSWNFLEFPFVAIRFCSQKICSVEFLEMNFFNGLLE
jgi:hypothetical protein